MTTATSRSYTLTDRQVMAIENENTPGLKVLDLACGDGTRLITGTGTSGAARFRTPRE